MHDCESSVTVCKLYSRSWLQHFLRHLSILGKGNRKKIHIAVFWYKYIITQYRITIWKSFDSNSQPMKFMGAWVDVYEWGVTLDFTQWNWRGITGFWQHPQTRDLRPTRLREESIISRGASAPSITYSHIILKQPPPLHFWQLLTTKTRYRTKKRLTWLKTDLNWMKRLTEIKLIKRYYK